MLCSININNNKNMQTYIENGWLKLKQTDEDFRELDNPFIALIAGLSILVASVLGLLYLASLNANV